MITSKIFTCWNQKQKSNNMILKLKKIMQYVFTKKFNYSELNLKKLCQNMNKENSIKPMEKLKNNK